MFWESGLERNAREGVMSCQVGVGYWWGYEYPECLNALCIMRNDTV